MLQGGRIPRAHARAAVKYSPNPAYSPIQSHSTLNSVKTRHRFSGVLPHLYIEQLCIEVLAIITHTTHSLLGSDSWKAELPHSDMVG